MVRLFSLLLLLIASTCHAAWPEDSICRVQATPPVGKVNNGTGEVVGVTGDRMLILTMHHVIEDNEKVSAVWADGTVQQGKVVARSKEKDLAAFTVPIIPSKMPVVLGSSFDSKQTFTGKGFPGGGAPKAKDLATVTGKHTWSDALKFKFTGWHEAGMSGGPVFDSKHRMVGVIKARYSKPKLTEAIKIDQINAFLKPLIQKVDVKQDGEVELSRFFGNRRTVRVQQPVRYSNKKPDKIVVEEQQQQVDVVVEDDDDAEPVFNSPVQNDDIDYVEQINNEVEQQVNEIDNGNDGGGNEPDQNDNKPDDNETPTATPPQPNREEQKLDQIIQQITNINNQQATNLQPVIEAINANKPDNSQLIALLEQILANQTKPAQEKAAPVYVLVTADFLCDDCPGVLAKAREVRDKKGINIRIVKLDGALTGLPPEQLKNIRLSGVPALFEFGSARTYVGSSECLDFLSTL